MTNETKNEVIERLKLALADGQACWDLSDWIRVLEEGIESVIETLEEAE